MTNRQIIRDWIAGKPVTIDGVVYIFPHGLPKIRPKILGQFNQ